MNYKWSVHFINTNRQLKSVNSLYGYCYSDFTNVCTNSVKIATFVAKLNLGYTISDFVVFALVICTRGETN